MDGVQYGRFDLRARSVEDLKRGEHFKVLEFNGVNSEPVHVYDPTLSIREVYQTLWYHWNLMYRIAEAQKEAGVDSMSVRDGVKAGWRYLGYKRKANASR